MVRKKFNVLFIYFFMPVLNTQQVPILCVKVMRFNPFTGELHEGYD